MSFKLVTEFEAATVANQDDAQYAANIFNSYRERISRPAGTTAIVIEKNGMWRVQVNYTPETDDGVMTWLAWEWFVIRRQATAPIEPGKYRVSFNKCAPGFSLEDAEACAKRDGNAKGYAVDYDTYKASVGAHGHCASSDLNAAVEVGPWICPLTGRLS
jgi:hypothetical protein